MSAESTRAYLARYGLDEKIITYDVLTATVEQAAEASGLEPGQIGKTMAFDVDGDAVLVVCAGDAKVWNSAFKRQFHTKPTFIKPEELEERAKLRRIYIDSVTGNLKEHLENTSIVYPDGSKKKVTRK